VVGGDRGDSFAADCWQTIKEGRCQCLCEAADETGARGALIEGEVTYVL
jgi:hypothetical protein